MGTEPRQSVVEGAIVDLDGTVYAGNRLLPGAVEGITFLRQRRIPHVYLTNNGSRTRTGVSEFLAALGAAIDPAEIITSSILVASQILGTEQNYPVLTLGGANGLPGALREAGLTTLTLGDDMLASTEVSLAIGWNERLDFTTLSRLLSVEECIKGIFATDRDRVYPGENGEPLPGTGWVVGAMEALFKREVRVCGKPSPSAFEQAASMIGCSIEKVAVIGDSPESDILPAIASHAARAVLIESAATEKSDVAPESRSFSRESDLMSALREVFG